MASTQAPNQSLSEVGLQFLETYFRETDFALTRHHIDSYEHCVFNEIPSIMAKAFYIAGSGRPGPVLIDIAKNAQVQKSTTFHVC
jgi:acetolactate synthase-1/2/3 large subunit